MNITHLVGVISDTHGLLRPEAVEALRGVELILHAGDVGQPDILDRLREIAPVRVVRGNVDNSAWGRSLPMTEVVEVGEVSIYMLHNIDFLDLDPQAARMDVVIYGHSHQPLIQHKKGVMYLNPGSAGTRRFSLPVSVALLRITGKAVEAELITLAV